MLTAQSGGSAPAAAAQDEAGFTSVIRFGGSVNSSGQVFKLDSNVGYDFNRHWGVAVGVPIYFAHSAGTSTERGSSNNGVGNPYVALRARFDKPVVNYRSAITGYVPLADSSTGFSTGRFTVDWTNHFDRTWSRLTPFAELGIGNTVTDSRLFERPFTSLGFNAHVEGGASLALAKPVSVGVSAYSIIPSGQQTVYSKLARRAAPSSTTVPQTQHGRMFETTARTTGSADLARDHGFSAWIAAAANSYVDLELGYTRSATYDLNTVAFNVAVNLGRMLKQKSRP
jgi:hypothetical protein